MNEIDFIRRLRKQAQRSFCSRLVAGIGDDAAVIDQASDRSNVISADLLIEDIDFRRAATTPRLLGHKALAVSLSDIAAMGARPFWSLVSIGLPLDVWKDNFQDEFFAGYLALADQYRVTLAGGDVSRAPERVVIDSIVLGEVDSGKEVLRSGAEAGDQIYVTGALGGAAAGLRLLELGARLGPGGLVSLPRASKRGSSPTASDVTEPRLVGVATGSKAQVDAGKRVSSPTVREGSKPQSLDEPELKAIETLLLRQLRPQPRVGWGIVLGEERLASAMIDVSDGLSSDLTHLCSESNVGALIQSANLPIDKNVVKVCGRRALDPLLLALNGGEDFELLFTVHPRDVPRLPKQVDGVSISHIGEITSERGKLRIAEKDRVWDLEAGGFNHFKSEGSSRKLARERIAKV
jgi:thiamine-monophosphate kinase